MEIGAINTSINGIINIDSKGVSKLYKSLNSGNAIILMNIINKWREKTGQIFTHDEIERAYIINHQSNVSMYTYFI